MEECFQAPKTSYRSMSYDLQGMVLKISNDYPPGNYHIPPKMAFWRWFCFSPFPKVGYVSSLEGIARFLPWTWTWGSRTWGRTCFEWDPWCWFVISKSKMLAERETTYGWERDELKHWKKKVVVTQRFFDIFTPKIGEDEPSLTHIFQMGWNHQLVNILMFSFSLSLWKPNSFFFGGQIWTCAVTRKSDFSSLQDNKPKIIKSIKKNHH